MNAYVDGVFESEQVHTSNKMLRKLLEIRFKYGYEKSMPTLNRNTT